jgi:hypothetical protein
MCNTAMNLKEITSELKEEDKLVVFEMLGKFYGSGSKDFWKRKLRREVCAEFMNMFIKDDE